MVASSLSVVMHIQSLESRTLFAVGLDPSFGSGGIATIPTNSSPETTLAVHGATFVETQTSSGRSIYRFDDSGHLDTSWGTNGRASIPIDITKMAYDTKTDALYASGSQYSSDSKKQSILIFRIAANGRLDTSYGESGLSIYTPKRPTTGDYTTTAVASKLLPQSGGRLLVAIDETLTLRSGIYVFNGTTRAKLLSLNSDGTPLTGFGSNGVTNVFAGTTTEHDDEFGPGVSKRDTYHIQDIQTQRDGSFRVIASETITDNIGAPQRNAFAVVSRTVTSIGRVDRALDQGFLLLDTGHTGSNQMFTPYYIGAEGAGIGVVGQVANSGQRAKIYHFNPTGGTTTYTFSAPVAVNTISGISGLGYFGSRPDGQVVKLNTNFRVDTSWGDQGVGGLDANGAIDRYTADEDGRVIVTSGSTVARLDGTLPAHNSALETAGVYGTTLEVLGTSGADSISITTDTANHAVRVVINGHDAVFDSRKIGAIAVDTGAGDDDVLVKNTVISTSISTGRGNDRVISGGEKGRTLAIDLGDGDDRAVLSAGRASILHRRRGRL